MNIEAPFTDCSFKYTPRRIQREILEVVGKYLQTRKKQIKVYHPLPKCFGDSKTHAELFSDNWNRYVPPGRAIFAKRGKGEEVLSTAKQKKQSVTNARSKIKSLWK